MKERKEQRRKNKEKLRLQEAEAAAEQERQQQADLLLATTTEQSTRERDEQQIKGERQLLGNQEEEPERREDERREDEESLLQERRSATASVMDASFASPKQASGFPRFSGTTFSTSEQDFSKDHDISITNRNIVPPPPPPPLAVPQNTRTSSPGRAVVRVVVDDGSLHRVGGPESKDVEVAHVDEQSEEEDLSQD